MKYTSAEAVKLLRKLNDEYHAVRSKENRCSSFLAAVGEDVESVRPEYSFEETQTAIKELETKIRTVKHAINMFNTTHIVPGFEMTIDQMLVYIPQLTERKTQLNAMKSVLPKERETSAVYAKSSIIDYRYANYDIKAVEEAYIAVSDELYRAQTALDLINSTEQMEIIF